MVWDGLNDLMIYKMIYWERWMFMKWSCMKYDMDVQKWLWMGWLMTMQTYWSEYAYEVIKCLCKCFSKID